MITRCIVARVCADSFRRIGVFRKIVEDGLPCVTERIGSVIGEAGAFELARIRYLATRAKILGYSSPLTQKRIAARVEELLPHGLEIPAPYSLSAIDNMPAARRIARSLNRDLFPSSTKVSCDEYALGSDDRDGLRLIIEFDGFRGFPDLRFFVPRLRLVVHASSFLSIDIEGHLRFDDLGTFPLRYRQTIELTRLVQREVDVHTGASSGDSADPSV